MEFVGGMVRLGIPRAPLSKAAATSPEVVLHWLEINAEKPAKPWTRDDACHLIFARRLREQGRLNG